MWPDSGLLLLRDLGLGEVALLIHREKYTPAPVDVSVPA